MKSVSASLSFMVLILHVTTVQLGFERSLHLNEDSVVCSK